MSIYGITRHVLMPSWLQEALLAASNRMYLPFVSCITIELYFKKVISRLLVCTSASKGSSAELITGTKQIRHVYPPQTQETTIQRTKAQTQICDRISLFTVTWPPPPSWPPSKDFVLKTGTIPSETISPALSTGCGNQQSNTLLCPPLSTSPREISLLV